MSPSIHPPEPSKPSSLAGTITSFLTKLLLPALPQDSFDTQFTPNVPLGRADKFPFVDLVSLVRNSPSDLRALPITAIESYQKGGEKAGPVPHRYSIVTIQGPSGGSTYLKLQLRAVEETLESILTAELADDRSGLVRPCDRRLAALELAPEHAARGPSLDALAELLDIIQKRTGRYDPHSRNCLWLADLVFFASAMKFKDVWLAEGRIFPDWPIRAFMRGDLDVLAASTQCFLPEGAPGWMGIAYGALGRVFGGFDMQREVEVVVGKWREHMTSVRAV